MEDKNLTDYEKQLNAEIENRLNTMESSEYEFPSRLQRQEYIIIALFAALCLVLLVWGAFL